MRRALSLRLPVRPGASSLPGILSLWRQCHAPNQSPDVTSRDDAGGEFGGLASSPRSLQKLTGRQHAQAGKTEMRNDFFALGLAAAVALAMPSGALAQFVFPAAVSNEEAGHLSAAGIGATRDINAGRNHYLSIHRGLLQGFGRRCSDPRRTQNRGIECGDQRPGQAVAWSDQDRRRSQARARQALLLLRWP